MKRMLGHCTAQWAMKRLSPTERGTSTGEQSIRPLSTMGWQEGQTARLAREAPIRGRPVPTMTIWFSLMFLAMA